MDMQLTDRRALITGSTSGIGYAIARALAAEGAQVTLTGRTQARVDEALKKLRKEVPGAKIDGVAADCATTAGAEKVFAQVPDTEILVNNLGIYERKDFFDIPDEDWQRLFEVNVMSGVRFTRFYAPKMAERKWGRVIFVSSESGLNIQETALQEQLAAEGYPVRVYVPFGTHWYPYFMRRLAERPENVAFMVRNVVREMRA